IDLELRNPSQPFLDDDGELGLRQKCAGTAVHTVAEARIGRRGAVEIDRQRIDELPFVESVQGRKHDHVSGLQPNALALAVALEQPGLGQEREAAQQLRDRRSHDAGLRDQAGAVPGAAREKAMLMPSIETTVSRPPVNTAVATSTASSSEMRRPSV